ncbi:MAG: glycosyltransferase [Actinobacteria bacterium]|nr:glycosyltransferase [Actinomycetota bacterium]MBV9255237.1 glycosyltransferase [Actinomycetota bacterium]
MISFSVVTPSYNYGRFLVDALESVRQQRDIADVEHVVVDGKSTDDTVEVLRAAPGNVRWVSEPDDGQTDALNKGFAMAAGDWVGWLNADEFYLPHTLASVAAAVEASPDLDVIYADGLFTDETGHAQKLFTARPYSRRMMRWLGPYPLTCTCFFRRELLVQHPMDTSLRLMMDFDLFLKLGDAGARWAYLPLPLGAFRLHEAQATTTPRPAFVDEAYRIRGRWIIPWEHIRVPFQAVNRLQEMASGAVSRAKRFAADHTGDDLNWWRDPDVEASVAQLEREFDARRR